MPGDIPITVNSADKNYENFENAFDARSDLLTTGNLPPIIGTANITDRMKLPAASVCLLFARVLFCQPAMPPWLITYPGASPQTKTLPVLVEDTYSTDAAAERVTEHYRNLFEAQGLAFHPNSDGIGTVLRAPAAECNLLISIRPRESGTFVRVSCASKAVSSASADSSAPVSVPGTLSSPPPGMSAGVYQHHQQLAAEMGLRKVYQDADAPPLVWPEWLVHVEGARLSVQQGVDRAGNAFLKSSYKTSAPMTSIFSFYKELLSAHDYPVNAGSMTTGQTQSGVRQNSDGRVDGINYPGGFPGPWTEIDVRFSRFYLNEPITVDLKFTTYAFKAPKPRGL
jgi:hypothetical protein